MLYCIHKTIFKFKILPIKKIDSISCFDLFYGIGCIANEKKAKEVCMSGASKGNKICQAIKLYNGWFTTPNKKRSFDIFQEMVEKDALSQQKDASIPIFYLALFYQKGEGGAKKDIFKSIKLYKQAIKLKNSFAMINLGYIYQSGSGGVKIDLPKAIELFEQAVELKNSRAIFKLASCYQNGEGGIKQDIHKAVELYKQAVDMKDPKAMYHLALIYQNAEGGLQDTKKATELLKQASSMGNRDSKKILQNCKKIKN